MMAIVAHHFVVNSTVGDHFSPIHPTSQQEFLVIWGMWGKTAINSFILISGYFLCCMQLTMRRYMKLVVQILFYTYLIMFVFAITGVAPFTLTKLYHSVLLKFMLINNGFTSSFLVFYAFVPFYNLLIKHLDRRRLAILVLGLLFVMTLTSTFAHAETMNEPVWYMTLYFVAAYIRLYPARWMCSLPVAATALAASVAAAVVSVHFVYHYAMLPINHFRFETDFFYYFVSDSNKLLAFTTGTAAFLVAKNLPPFHSRIINFLGAGTFAVLLIHAASNDMRRWLWVETLNVPAMLNLPLPTLVVQSILIPPAIFLFCSCVDYFRRQFIEKPLFNHIFRPKKH